MQAGKRQSSDSPALVRCAVPLPRTARLPKDSEAQATAVGVLTAANPFRALLPTLPHWPLQECGRLTTLLALG